MASTSPKSQKHQLINKANSNMVIAVSISAFIVVFCLVASKSLLDQRSYQARVITKKKAALAQLESNNQDAQELVARYESFVNTSTNIIGGETSGDDADRDGDNAKIILDALPSQYDFPAVATSLEKILDDRKFTVNGISGEDDVLNQQNQDAGSGPIEMPFEIDVTGKYSSVQSFIEYLERSIRPIQINQLGFEGRDEELTITINGQTYYQPAKTLDIKKEIVK